MSKAEVESLETLQVSLQQNPESLTFARVADALMKNGRLDEAIRICEEGIRRHPYYVTGHMVLGKCYMQKKYFDQAEKEFKRVLHFDSKYIAAHRYYGDLMREIGWENTCEMSYRKIQHLDPLDEKVRGIVEEFARKAETSKPMEPPVVPAASAPRPAPAPKPAPPKESREATTTTFKREERVAPPAPAPTMVSAPEPVNGDFEIPIVKRPAPEPMITTAPTPSLNKNDEARFSSILDDIFQDEMLDEASSNVAAYQRGKTDVASPTPVPPAPKKEEPTREDHSAWKRAAKEEKPKVEIKAAPTMVRDSNARENLEANLAAAPSTPSKRRPVDLDLDLDELAASEERIWAPAARKPAETQSRTEPAIVAKAFEGDPLAPGGLRESSRDKIVTPTLGEIYAAQGQYAKAIGVFELLSKKDPANRTYREKIDYLKKRLQETQNAG